MTHEKEKSKWSRCIRKNTVNDTLLCRPAIKGEVIIHLNPALSHVAKEGEIIVKNELTGYMWTVNRTTFDRFYQLLS